MDTFAANYENDTNLDLKESMKIYLVAYNDYLRLLNTKKKSESQIGDYIFLKFNNTTIHIEKPVYTTHGEIMCSLKEKKESLMRTYVLEKKRLVYKGSDNNLDTVKQLTLDIINVNKSLTRLEEIFVNEKELLRVHANVNVTEDSSSQTNLSDILELSDDIERAAQIKKYVNRQYIKEVFHSEKHKSEQSDFINRFNTIILKIPVVLSGMNDPFVEETSSEVEPTSSENRRRITEEKQKKREEKKMKSKIKKSIENNTTSMVDLESNAKISAKKSITQYLFKTLEQCESSKRTQPYFMSKNDLIKLINADPKLKKKLGPKFAKLSKKEICNEILT
jgi:hypothetical protein